MKKLIALLMVFALALTCLAGCASTPAENSEPANDDAKGVIVVGYTNYAPMNYEDENGTLVGFDTELAQKVFTNLGYTVRFQLIDWNSKYTELNSGTIDCIWNGFTCNTSDDDGVARAEKVDFSYNYMENLQVVVVKKDSTIKTAADLKGKRAVAESGSAGETYAKTFNNVTVKGCPYQTDCLTEVNGMTADFAVLDNQLAKSYCGKGNYADLQIVEGLQSEVEYYAVGFKKGSDLTAKVNAEFEKLGKDGTLKALAEKYGVEGTALYDFADQK